MGFRGVGFSRARARSGAGVLVALGLIVMIAATLVTGIVGAVRAIETATVVDSIAQTPHDRGMVIVRFEGTDTLSAEQVAAVDRSMEQLGLDRVLKGEVEGPRVIYRPDPARFTVDAAPFVITTLPDLQRAVRAQSGEQVQVSGGLRATLLSINEAVQSRRGPTGVALGIVGLLTAVVVASAAVEPVRTRLAERALLRARGVSKPRLARIALIESAPVLLLSAALGAGLGAVVTWLWSGTIMEWPLVATIAGALAIVGAGVVAVATVRGVDRRSGRADVLTGIAAIVLLAVATALAAWQFWEAGSPVIVQSNGNVAVDPLIAIAPALVMALFALIAVVLSGPVAAVFAGLLRRSRGMTPVVPLRLAARRTGRHALTTGTVAFAAATITVALVYMGTLNGLGDTPEELRVGADVRVTSIPDDTDRAVLSSIPGVDAAMPARMITARGSDSTIPILAVQASTLGEVMHDADGLIDPDALAQLLTQPPMGLAIPRDAENLTATIRLLTEPEYYIDFYGDIVFFDPQGITVTVNYLNVDGRVYTQSFSNTEVTFEEFENGDTWMSIESFVEATSTLPLPEGEGWSMISIDASQNVGYSRVASPVDIEIEVELLMDGEIVDLSEARGPRDMVTVVERGIQMHLETPGWRAFNPVITRASMPGLPTRFPVIFTEALASSMGVDVGTQMSLRMSSFNFTVDVEIVGLVPILPGVTNDQSALMSLSALWLSTSEPIIASEMWMSTGSPLDVAEAADAAVGGARVAVTDPESAAKAAETAYSFLLAAAGAVLLAIVVLVLRRSRGDGAARELGLLAIMGLGRGRAARVRALEDSFAIVLGVLGGIAAGFLVAYLTVPSLTRAAYVGMSESFPIALIVAPGVLAAALAVAAAVFIFIAATVRVPSSLAPVLREAE